MKDPKISNLVMLSCIWGVGLFVLFSVASIPIEILVADAQNVTNATEPFGNMTVSPESSVHISKDSSIDYSIKYGMALIGAFDNTYTITGDTKSLSDAKNRIISTIQDDFLGYSPAGYVLAEGMTSAIASNTSAITSNNTSIANPFASPDTIKARIISEISKSIDSLANMEFRLVAVHCDFDSLITGWNCNIHPRLQ